MRILLLALTMLVFMGCAGIMSDIAKKDVREWQAYVENNASLEYISFYAIAGANKQKVGEHIGEAVMRVNAFGMQTSKSIGPIFAMPASKSIILIDLKSGKSIDLALKSDFELVQNSGNFKLYEFGLGIVETVVFSVKDGSVCQSFKDKKQVASRSVTNYMIGSGDEFFTTITEAKLRINEGYEIDSIDYQIYANKTLKNDVLNTINHPKFKDDVIGEDLKKQGRFLLNFLCYSFFE
ncbi:MULTISPECIES: hypothetical protein [unclassified Campylobacter]|uniref:hypothetical protein n=1 Tax=unclassified Campylobacter TaxID=2593542 RepID=UPI003D355D61